MVTLANNCMYLSYVIKKKTKITMKFITEQSLLYY